MWREKNPVGGVVLGKNASACGKKKNPIEKQKFEPISKLVNSHGRWGTTEAGIKVPTVEKPELPNILCYVWSI